MEAPKTNDMAEWVDYFMACNEQTFAQGLDMAGDRDIMLAWFCHIYMLGYAKGKFELAMQEANVDSIEEYLKSL